MIKNQFVGKSVFIFCEKINGFAGGLPNIEYMTGSRNISTGFIGCIHSLQIQNSGVINFADRAISSVNVLPCQR